MVVLFSLIPATVFLVIGYFVLHASARSQGALKPFGQYLAIWLFILAGLIVFGGLLGPLVGLQGPMGGMMTEGMGQHMQRMETMQEEQLAILRELRED
ncbi:MAG TPA: hypothetical protein VIV64_08745 [Gammaproteobacteria bacterium]